MRFTPARPSGLAEVDVFAALQFGDTPTERLLSTGARTLEVSGEHLTLLLPQAQLLAGPLVFDAMHRRLGELVFAATRAVLGAEETTKTLVTLSEGKPL